MPRSSSTLGAPSLVASQGCTVASWAKHRVLPPIRHRYTALGSDTAEPRSDLPGPGLCHSCHGMCGWSLGRPFFPHEDCPCFVPKRKHFLPDPGCCGWGSETTGLSKVCCGLFCWNTSIIKYPLFQKTLVRSPTLLHVFKEKLFSRC